VLEQGIYIGGVEVGVPLTNVSPAPNEDWHRVTMWAWSVCR
jgi:hypothetical protein